MKTRIIALVLFLALTSSISVTAIAETPEPQITAVSAILIDADSGQLLWEKNCRQQLAMASTTKMITAILTLENSLPDSRVFITSDIESVGEEEIFLQAGEVRTVRELLYATLVKSANDASVALARHIGKSVPEFVDMMNVKAAEIGAKNTHFANPHGLTAPGHFSTAFDLALIGRYCLQNKAFAKICQTQTYAFDWPGKEIDRVMENHNKLLLRYPGTIGIKTGYTQAAGHCLVGAARKNGFTLISVVLNAPDSETCFSESQAILEYGFSNYLRYPLVVKGEAVQPIREGGINGKLIAVAENDLFVVVPADAQPELQAIVTFQSNLQAPIAKGSKVGELTAILNGKEMGNVDLIANQTLIKPSLTNDLLAFIQLFIDEII